MKVISGKYLPTYVPLNGTITLGLLLDRLKAPSLAWGILGTLVTIWWIFAAYVAIKEERVHPSKV